MDDRLQLLADQGADITVKLSRKRAFVQIRMSDNTYKGSGGNLTKATDRVLEAFNSRSSSVKKERRAKEEFREELLEYGL